MNSILPAPMQLVIAAVACCIRTQGWVRVIRSEISRHGCLSNFGVREGIMPRGAAALIVVSTAFAAGLAFAADGQFAPTAPQLAIPNAPASAVWFEGNGNNIIDIDWENDIVAVVRWINPGPSLNDVVGKMLASIKTPTQKDALAKYTGPHTLT